jgi:FHS family L-fucose permease-like MFS transporter
MVGGALLFIPSARLAGIQAISHALAVLSMAVLNQGKMALFLIVLCGVCNYIIWPVIFPLAITRLGNFTKQGAFHLMMTIVGRALWPPLMGFITTHGGFRGAFMVPALRYA